MSSVFAYKLKYLSTEAKGEYKGKRFNPTHQWVKYTLDIKDMRKMLLIASFEDRFTLMEALKVAERKRDWHFRQEEFDLSDATAILSAVERTQNNL